jgi:oxygen-dependent protoporphyrinogen oxidase
MRLRKHAPLLGSTLKHVALRPLTASQCTRYRYSSTSAAYPERVAVFGGGIAGLSSAHFIAKEFPKTKITIFEGGSETGGWIRSKRVKVPGGDVLFEAGPRGLRSSIPTALLVS